MAPVRPAKRTTAHISITTHRSTVWPDLARFFAHARHGNSGYRRYSDVYITSNMRYVMGAKVLAGRHQ